MATFNPDGVSVKGCNYIYAPKGQAGETHLSQPILIAGVVINVLTAMFRLLPNKIGPQFDAGAVPRTDFLKHLRKDALRYQALGITAQVMFSFTTDVYNPGDVSLTRPSLEIIAEHGLGFCTLTKGGTRALRDIDMFRPDRDAFASTLTTLDDAFSLKWEREAALPGDRIAALKAFSDRGIFTWVSLEPTLDVEASLEIINSTFHFVNLFKIGRANYLKEITRVTDWRSYTLRVIDLCQRLGVRHYIKKDLQPYLPDGYFNPLRVAQHYGGS